MADDQKKLENDDFEVETPEEAQRGIAEQIGDAVGDAVPSLQKDEFETHGSFFSQVAALLRMAGLTFKKVFSCLLLLVVIGGIFYFVKSIGQFSFWTSSDVEETVSRSIDQVQKNLAPQSLISDSDFDFSPNFVVGSGRGIRSQKIIPAFVQNAYIFGKPLPPASFLAVFHDALNLAYFYGYRGVSSDRFEYYISTLSSLNSGLSTDTHALLDASTKRSDALDHFIRDLQGLHQTALQMQIFVDQEIFNYTTQFDANSVSKKDSEIAFFNHINNFESKGSHENLDSFILAAQEGVDIKARLLALRKIKAFYAAALPKLDTKIRDLQLNRDALIKNVTVVDVKNSDLKLIVPESQRLGE